VDSENLLGCFQFNLKTLEKEKSVMKCLKKINSGLFATILLLAPIYPSPARERNPEPSADRPEMLNMEITLPGGKPRMVYLRAHKKNSVILPISADDIFGVKVVATIDGGLAKFEVFSVLEALPEKGSCDTFQNLRADRVGSYSGREGDKMSIRAGKAPIAVKLLKPNARDYLLAENCCCSFLGQCLCSYPPPNRSSERNCEYCTIIWCGICCTG
jgi:hypothetical protein